VCMVCVPSFNLNKLISLGPAPPLSMRFQVLFLGNIFGGHHIRVRVQGRDQDMTHDT